MESCATPLSPPTDGSLTPSDFRFKDDDRAPSLLKGFAVLYENHQFTDVVLCVDDKEFPCHKNVLAVSSPYFMGMFSSDLVESHQDRVVLNAISSQTLQLILDYIYKGEVVLSEETVQNLLSASNLFQLISLRNGCADFMIKHVTVTNCIGMYFFACAHECAILAEKAKVIINNQIALLCKEQEFLQLPVDKLIEILNDDQLNVSDEKLVYEVCLGWLNYNLDSRKEDMMKIMNCVRFANISSYYFCDNIDSNPLFDECNDLKDILRTVRYYHMLRNRQFEMDLNYMPRKGMPYRRSVLIIANPYCEENSKKLSSMEELNLTDGLVSHVCHLPKSLYMPGCAVTGDNQVYIAGGAVRKINYRGSMTTEEISDALLVFDPTSGSWQIGKAKLSEPRYQFALIVLDGYMYAVGGQNGTSLLSIVEQYDIHMNVWQKMAPLPEPLRCCAGVGYKGKLYVFGGEGDSGIVNSSLRYDPTVDQWSSLADMSLPKALMGTVVYKDQIYVIGGNTAVSDKWTRDFLPEHCTCCVEIFDPVQGSWSEGPSLPAALCGAGVVKYNNTILVVGGEDDKSWMASTFSLSKNSSGESCWQEGHELPTVMSTCGCVVGNLPSEML